MQITGKTFNPYNSWILNLAVGIKQLKSY